MPVSTAFRREVYRQETDEVFILLMTITHPDLATPIRVALNGENVTSRGETYVGYPFEIALPPDREDEPGRTTVRIDNIGTVEIDGAEVNLVHTIRGLTGKPVAFIEIVLASDPDTVEVGPLELDMVEAPYDASTIEAELAYDDVLNEPYPPLEFTPANFPGLFP